MSKWDYTDSTLLGNFINLSQSDVSQTSKKVQIDKTHTEDNPLIKPIVDNTSPDTFTLLSMLGTAILADRWAKTEDSTQRRGEMVLANVIEAAALHYSGEPWRLQWGMEF